MHTCTVRALPSGVSLSLALDPWDAAGISRVSWQRSDENSINYASVLYRNMSLSSLLIQVCSQYSVPLVSWILFIQAIYTFDLWATEFGSEVLLLLYVVRNNSCFPHVDVLLWHWTLGPCNSLNLNFGLWWTSKRFKFILRLELSCRKYTCISLFYSWVTFCRISGMNYRWYDDDDDDTMLTTTTVNFWYFCRDGYYVQNEIVWYYTGMYENVYGLLNERDLAWTFKRDTHCLISKHSNLTLQYRNTVNTSW